MYKFTKDCMTGIESIDKEHEQLFKIINEAQALLEEQAVDVKTVKSIVAHLVDYAAEHFAHEEAYMESINDPELMRQKKEHTDFANKVKSVDFDNMTDDEREEYYKYAESNNTGDYLDLADTTKTYGEIDTTEKSIADTISYKYKLDDKKNYTWGYTRGYSSVYDYSDNDYDSKGIKNKIAFAYENKDLFTLSLSLQDYKDYVTSLNDEKRFVIKYDYKKNNLPKVGNEANVQLTDSTGAERLSLTEEELAAIDKKYNEEKRKEQGLGFDIMGIGEEEEEVIYKQYYALTVDGIRNEHYYRASNNFMDSLESLDISLEAHYNRFKLKYTFDQVFSFTENNSVFTKTMTTKEHEFSALTMIGKDTK